MWLRHWIAKLTSVVLKDLLKLKSLLSLCIQVTSHQTLRNLIASYYEHPDYGWIIKSLTFVTNRGRHVAGPADGNDAVFEARTIGDIVDVFWDLYPELHKVNWCL